MYCGNASCYGSCLYCTMKRAQKAEFVRLEREKEKFDRMNEKIRAEEEARNKINSGLGMSTSTGSSSQESGLSSIFFAAVIGLPIIAMASGIHGELSGFFGKDGPVHGPAHKLETVTNAYYGSGNRATGELYMMQGHNGTSSNAYLACAEKAQDPSKCIEARYPLIYASGETCWALAFIVTANVQNPMKDNSYIRAFAPSEEQAREMIKTSDDMKENKDRRIGNMITGCVNMK